MRTETFVLRWISAPVPFARRCAPRAAARCAAGRPPSHRGPLDNFGDQSLAGRLVDPIMA
ncbi:hypothetical protein ACMHYB_33325 [Sorangium sp. So ce1128]